MAYLMRILPKAIGQQVARLLMATLCLSMPRLSTVAAKNLALVFPEKTKSDRHKILKQSFDNLAKTLFDFAQVDNMNREWVESNCEITELRQVLAEVRAKANGKGILIGAVHFGSFELLFQAYAFIDRPVSVLARTFGMPRLDQWWNTRRQLHGHKVFARKGGHKEILARLERGDDVAVLFDQNVKRKHAAFIDFFGTPAATSRSMGLVALKTGCPIVFVACAQASSGKYRFFVEEIQNSKNDTGSFRVRSEKILERLHVPLERIIREYPEQWFWIHRRFKTRPVGEPENFYDS